jgi:2-polyprenyl-6-methoxyphenol hydroxylase-like FAD-dependent oxidoreductase
MVQLERVLIVGGGIAGLAVAASLHRRGFAAEIVESALESYMSRRKPRVQWVQEQSRAVAESFRMPAAMRNAGLQARGEQWMQARYAPLLPAP